MRIVATLAAILALPCGVFADEPQASEINATISQPAVSQPAVAAADVTTSGKYDTSVYHLSHTRARQIIPAVRQALCKSLAAEAAAGQPPVHPVVSIVFMPTTADDALVAICPREHAALVKQAVEDCDVEKQYAVKVQLFEISPNGEAVQVGEPSVVVGREGSVQCKTSGDGPVTLKLKLSDAAPVAAAASQAAPEAESADEVYCSGPDCGQPEAEVTSPKSVCPTACSEPAAGECTCPLASGQCPASCSGSCALKGSKCPACNGTCASSSNDEAACSCKSGGDCTCKGKCACSGKSESAASRGTWRAGCGVDVVYEADSSGPECADSCQKCGGSCGESQALTAEEYRLLVRILINHWALEHQEHVGGVARDEAAPAETGESASDCDSSAMQESLIVPAASGQAPTEKPGVDLGCPAPAPSTAEVPAATNQTAAPSEQAPVPIVMGNVEEGALFHRRPQSNDEGFRFGGVYRLCPGDHDDVAVTHVGDSCAADSTAQDCGVPCQNPSVEPPALLTLSARKDATANLGIVISPRWQSELSKIYQGRRLSEIFEPHNGQDPGAAALGRLLAEIPKPDCQTEGDNPRHRNVIVVDLPDRIRVFESLSDTETAAAPPCANCREQFRAFLEEVVRGSNLSGLEEIAQTGHVEYDPAVAEPPRELPSVSQSKLDTTVVTYPLRDLVLLDDEERPVFDTCTIIDHIQTAVAPESWGHPSVSIQLDQQSMSLVIRQSPDVHQKIETHLRDLRRLQVKHLCHLIERLSAESESSDD